MNREDAAMIFACAPVNLKTIYSYSINSCRFTQEGSGIFIGLPQQSIICRIKFHEYFWYIHINAVHAKNFCTPGSINIQGACPVNSVCADAEDCRFLRSACIQFGKFAAVKEIYLVCVICFFFVSGHFLEAYVKIFNIVLIYRKAEYCSSDIKIRIIERNIHSGRIS